MVEAIANYYLESSEWFCCPFPTLTPEEESSTRGSGERPCCSKPIFSFDTQTCNHIKLPKDK
jgi:hypothetical protein